MKHINGRANAHSRTLSRSKRYGPMEAKPGPRQARRRAWLKIHAEKNRETVNAVRREQGWPEGAL